MTNKRASLVMKGRIPILSLTMWMIWGNVLSNLKKRGCQNKIKFTQKMRTINFSEGVFEPISRNKLCTEIKKKEKPGVNGHHERRYVGI